VNILTLDWKSAPEKERNWEQGTKMGLSFKLDFKSPYTVLGQRSKAWDSHCEMVLINFFYGKVSSCHIK